MENLPENQNLSKETLNIRNKKVPLGLALFILIVLGFGVWGYYFIENKKNQNLPTIPSISQKPVSKYTSTQLTLDELKKILPAGIPLEPDTQVLQSQSIKDKEGTEQITYQFITKKTLTENFNLYKTYLERNSWKIQNIINEPDIKSISAAKETEKKTINITISKNTITDQSIVDISLLLPPNTGKNIAAVQNILLAKTKIIFPPYTKTEKLTQSQIPKELKNFITDNFEAVEAWSIVYPENQKGILVIYKTEYPSLKNLVDILREIAKNNNWQSLLTGRRTDSFSFYEFFGYQQQLRITLTQIDKKNIEIVLQTIKNQ
jgi:hypothetical protein